MAKGLLRLIALEAVLEEESMGQETYVLEDGAADVPPKVELKGNGRRPLNPSSSHFTSAI
ncbi:hypothetical protein V2J09_018948 [Rumex salicifolius]